MKLRKILALLLAVITITACFASCGEDVKTDDKKETKATDTQKDPNAPVYDGAVEGDLAYIKENGKLVVGITDFAPCDYQDENGEWIGFDADLAKKFGEYIGVDVEFVEIEWESKFLELEGMTIDCVWNGMTLNDEVKASMATSDPYLNNAQIVVVPKDIAAEFSTVEKCKDLVVAVEAGSAGKDAAEDNGFAYTEVQMQSDALMEVAAGSCDGAIIDSLMAAAMVGEGTAYEDLTYTVQLTTEEYGVGFRKDSNMADVLNSFFAQCKADGTMETIAEVYGVQAALIK